MEHKMKVTLFSALFLACVTSISLWSAEPQLIIVRHGEAMHNVQDVYNSNPSHPNYKPSNLTETGKEKVLETAKQLMKKGFGDQNIGAVYVSPLPRTMQTADALVKAGLVSRNKIVVEPRITENLAGDLEGKPVMREWKSEYAQKYHTESNAQFEARVRSFYDEKIDGQCEGSILVVTHGGVAVKLMEYMKTSDRKPSPGEAKLIPLNCGHILQHVTE